MIKRLFLGLLFSPALFAQKPQIAVPRIAQMPNQPAPYNMRDWKETALKYDSFVYNLNKTGQYLPLIALQNSGFNYPQSPAFSLHTYVGTNNPNGNEAINVLPSVVGASLCGVDKTKQFGRNWLQMSQDFFAKSNGLGIYLNNKGGGSGSDWWYDMMPNVYFYQLCDLYPPAAGSEAAAQFLSVAEKMRASVRALGGGETPWKSAFFDYRAFNFQTMQPNAAGVHEPEAAGAYAWILYCAFLQTGDSAYLKAAEQSLEFLDAWPSNPSYELQLPYGTLAAARMNAEIGTRYNVEKMINWTFDRGPLRGWGAVVGKWGSFDCSGLIGEANDAGNDYAFMLNGIQQAAALVPLARYDKRFAHAIGKWVLNLANATRLFFPGYLPSNYQDATAWSNAYDPDRVIGYEALRQKWQGLSPFSTGDALKGGWAGTNLSLYSAGSIGYLGAMVEKTNVDKILKIDVLKTDFYKEKAYPTYLFFNPYETAQSVLLDAGPAPADLYDAISEQFIKKNVQGPTQLSIPANGVLLATICPAGGIVAYEHNKMLVNGVVTDYMQSAQAWSRPPRIQSLAAAQTLVAKGAQAQIFSKTQAGDSPELQYEWSASAGQINAVGSGGQWTAPDVEGPATLRLIVRDGNGLSDTATLTISVVAAINQAPQIEKIDQNAYFTAPGGSIQLHCVAQDANGDPLAYEWSFTGGNYSGSGPDVEWTAPNAEGIYEAKVKASDGKGLSATASVQLLVRNFSETSGRLVAHYNFSGNANDLTVNQLHGIPFNTVYVPDVFGTPQRAMYFNGVNSRVSVAAQPVLNFQDGITVSAWFRANELPSKESFLLSHGSWQNRWKISFTPEKRLRWTINTLNGIADLDVETPLETDRFYHVSASYDGQLLAIYLDGRLSAFKFFSGKIRQTNIAFLMGQMLPGATEYNFKGVVDEVKIYDYALAPESARQLYQSATTGLSAHTAWGAPAIFPNPAREGVFIRSGKTKEGISGELLPSHLRIFDAAGRLVFEQKQSAEQVFVSISNWNPGVYTVVLTTGDRAERGIFIKE